MLLYIDPGTGSMLFSMVIGLVTALVFAGRALTVKLRFLFTGGSSRETQKKKNPFVIYSDSKRYHNIFAPICDAFEERKQRLIYYTQSPDDPLLDKEYRYVACEFIGEGNKGIARMNMLQADVCLSTTPGLNVLQWKRSRDVGYYVHIPHAVSDFSTYRMFGLDYYDAVLINGDNQKRFIRKIEDYWKIKEKELVMTGSVYMDEAAKRLDGLEEHVCDLDHPTILVAASWGENTLLKRYGSRLLKPLAETGFHIIVRPHPQSFVSEADMLAELQKEFPPSENFEWNSDVDNLAVLNRADLMISDFSGVIFDYSFLFGRPVFYADIDFDKSVYDADWFDEEPWDTSVLPEIGRKLEEKEFADIKNILLAALQDQKLARGIEKVKEDCWRNRGGALDATVNYLIQKQKDISAKEQIVRETKDGKNAGKAGMAAERKKTAKAPRKA